MQVAGQTETEWAETHKFGWQVLMEPLQDLRNVFALGGDVCDRKRDDEACEHRLVIALNDLRD